MAAEDDDTFGNFTFASFPPNPPPTATFHSHHLAQSNGINSSPDDDEWGDFVEFPSQFSSIQSEPSKSYDSFEVAANQSGDTKLVSPTRWVKPSGALPLSLFGDAEEEEHGAGVDLNSNFGSNGSDLKSVGNTNIFGVNDIIANLYNQTPQVKYENGSGTSSSPRVDSNANDLILDNKSQEVKVENGLYSSSKLNAVSSGFSEWNLDLRGMNLNSNVNGTKSFSDQRHENGSGTNSSTRVDSNAKDLVLDDKKVENGVHSSSNLNDVSSGFSEWNMEFNGMNLNSNVDGTKSSSDQSLENGSDTNSSSRVDSNVNDLVLDGKSRDVKVENEFDSCSKSNAVSSGFIEWDMDFNQMNLNSNANGMKSLSDQSQQIKSENSGLSIKLNGSYPYQDGSSSHLFGGWTLELNKFSSSANTLNANVNTLSSNLDMNEKELDGATCDDDKDDDEDEGWEFKDAYSEWRPGDVNNMVDTEEHVFSDKNAYSSGIGNGSIDLFGTANQSIDLFSASTEVDLVSTSSDFHSSSQEVNLFDIQSSIAAPISFISDTNLNIERTDIKDGLNPNSDVGYAESDDGFGEFTTAFSESEPKPREALDDDMLSPSKEAALMPDGKVQGKETRSNNHKGALPLSIFGDEEPETNGHVDVQDAFMHQPTSYQRNGHTSNSVISINDLISNLYSQTKQASSVDTVQKPIEIKLSPSDAVSNSDVVHNDSGDFDDNTWEFMDASSGKRNNDEASLFSVEGDHLISSSKLQLNNFVDYYSRLMDELCFIAEVHIERLKNAQSTAALLGEFAKVAALDNEILEASKELDQMNVIFKEDDSLDHPSGESYLKEFIEILLEPKFLVLESEYHLSEKLLLAEQDLRLAIELIKHTTTMIKILKLGTLDEQQMYVTTWSKMISVCSQELEHGSLIWKQAIEKKIQSQILSETQGREFILALGEIYRVVVILEASAKIFKPWTISCWSSIQILLEECHTLWSTSGFEEALMSVSETSSSDDASLMKSIKYISGLDAFALQNCVFTQHESLCRLSILSVGAVPGMKMIMWEDEQYFVTLANLWANIVSNNPPELPHLHIGR
ncbi:unnamed protein product [Fraxinus pennsylvanica]|uniref:Synergin gamma C-terminal domain-containing protein n=1 Tax=Fraxinus pennsylvanica TaxID=56036 RepID=A0AAD1Z8D1_9LAMI|nr:unnamed protein product [Fraxinus pennsylvanica]